MAIDDRDYMRDRERKRDNYTEKSHFRRSMSGESPYYEPKQFRGGRVDQGEPGSWSGAIFRTVVICLAVYGALSVLRDVHGWSQRKKIGSAAQPLALDHNRKESAWGTFYRQPEYCNYATDKAWQRCLEERSHARRQFEQLYAQGKL